MTFDELKAAVVAAGYRVSCASWEDNKMACVFSVETHGPATYNHPKFAATYDKETGWVSIGSRHFKVPE